MPSSPNPLTFRVAVRVKAHAVVLDDEEDVIGAPLEDDLDAPCAEYLATLVSASCAMRYKRRLDVRREPIVEQARRVQARGNADALRPVLDVVGQRGPQAEVVERGRAELPDELIHVPIEAPGDRLEGHRSRVRGPCGQRTAS